MGIIVPTGIATDDTTKFFFQSLMDQRSLVSLYDFENRKSIFPTVDSRLQVLSVDRRRIEHTNTKPQFRLLCLKPLRCHRPGQSFHSRPEEIALLNPNTRTAPIFRSTRDAHITKASINVCPC